MIRSRTAPAHGVEPTGGERPRPSPPRHQTPGAQDAHGPIGPVRCHAHVHAGIAQDKIFEVDEIALEPQRRAGVGEVRALARPSPPQADGGARARRAAPRRPRLAPAGWQTRSRAAGPGWRKCLNAQGPAPLNLANPPLAWLAPMVNGR